MQPLRRLVAYACVKIVGRDSNRMASLLRTSAQRGFGHVVIGRDGRNVPDCDAVNAHNTVSKVPLVAAQSVEKIRIVPAQRAAVAHRAGTIKPSV